jgi:hypothetical protein
MFVPLSQIRSVVQPNRLPKHLSVVYVLYCYVCVCWGGARLEFTQYVGH